MELAWIVYGISMLDGLGAFLNAIFFVTCVIAGGSAIFTLAFTCDSPTFYSYDQMKKEEKQAKWNANLEFFRRLLKGSLIILAVSGVLRLLTPTEKVAYMMVGAYATQQVAQSDMTKKILNVLNAKVDSIVEDALAELEKKKGKK